MPSSLFGLEVLVGWHGGESIVIYRATDGKMIQALIACIFDSKNMMYRVIEKAPDPGTTDTAHFSLKVKYLSNGPTFPIKPRVKPGAIIFERFLESADHA